MAYVLEAISAALPAGRAVEYPGGFALVPLCAVAVAQTMAVLDFLCVCDEVTIHGWIISVGEVPLWPAQPVS